MLRRILSVVLCLLLVFLLPACGNNSGKTENNIYVEFLNGDRDGLIPVLYKTLDPDGAEQNATDQDTLEKATEMLTFLSTPSENIRYSAPLRDGVSIRNVSLQGQVLYLDFDSGYGELPPLEEILIRASLVLSLTRIDNIEQLRFTVNGEDLKDSSGRFHGYMGADDFVQNSGSSPILYRTEMLTIFFSNKDGDTLVEEAMEVKYNSYIAKERLVMEKLMQGPQTEGAYPVINPEATLLSITIRDRICYINFDQEFQTGAYNVKPEIVIQAIVNTICNETAAKKVQIMVNGDKNVQFMNKVDLSQPLEKDMEWPAE